MTHPLPLAEPGVATPYPDHARYDVAVVGLGYIGLPTAAVLADTGLSVRGVDLSPAVVGTVNDGRVHIEERDLDALVRGVVAAGARYRPEPRFPSPIPMSSPSLPRCATATRPTSPPCSPPRVRSPPRLRTGSCVIVESTCPIGTTREVEAVLAALRPRPRDARPLCRKVRCGHRDRLLPRAGSAGSTSLSNFAATTGSWAASAKAAPSGRPHSTAASSMATA